MVLVFLVALVVVERQDQPRSRLLPAAIMVVLAAVERQVVEDMAQHALEVVQEIPERLLAPLSLDRTV
jgi:hypothetical protein